MCIAGYSIKFGFKVCCYLEIWVEVNQYSGATSGNIRCAVILKLFLTTFSGILLLRLAGRGGDVGRSS